MTTDTIRAAAEAAFKRYYFGRRGYHWDTAGNAMQQWWIEIAARVLNGEFTAAWQCHAYYTQLGPYPVLWSDIKTATKDRWVQAFHAIKWAGVAAKDAA